MAKVSVSASIDKELWKQVAKLRIDLELSWPEVITKAFKLLIRFKDYKELG